MDRQVSPSTQNQALNAVVFLFKSVLKKVQALPGHSRVEYDDDLYPCAQQRADGCCQPGRHAMIILNVLQENTWLIFRYQAVRTATIDFRLQR